MKSGQKIQQARLSKWAVLFQEQASSGLTIKDWCSQNDVSIHAFYYWKRIAKETYVNSLIPDIVPLPIANAPFLPDASPSAPAEHELYNLRESCETPTPVSDSVRVSVGDIHIEIGSNASDEMISRIIKAVRYVQGC